MAPLPPLSEWLIAGRYAVDTARLLRGAAGNGLAAFAASDRSGALDGLMAVQVQRTLPPRAGALAALTEPIEGVLSPLAHGPAPGPGGEGAYYVICPAPPGPSLDPSAQRWTEDELLEHVLRPAARTLDRLERAGVTHRAIRADNVFRDGPGRKVVLGSAWAAPPAAHQSAVSEPPYVAICAPAARGDGTIADDVYALGVLLLTLALGRSPLAGVDSAAIVARKLDLGSFAALAGGERLPPIIADLLRGMLAEDPDHRPSPALLTEPAAARARRVAARPTRRAQRSLLIGEHTVWSTRALALALATAPEAGLAALRAGWVDHWLRRSLGEAAVAAGIEEAVRTHAGGEAMAGALLLMVAIARLDPLAPLCWQGVNLWPDGLGPALAAAPNAGTKDYLVGLIAADGLGVWAAARADRCDAPALRIEARRMRAWLDPQAAAEAQDRLLYRLNPLLPCASRHLDGAWVAQLPDLLPALEAAGRPERRQGRPVDAQIAAFISARVERGPEGLPGLGATPGSLAPVAELQVLARLQAQFRIGPLPALAGWIAETPEALLHGWRGKARRSVLAERIKAKAPEGQLAAMLAVIKDPVERDMDARESQAAAAELAWINAEIGRVQHDVSSCAEMAQRWGQELAAGVGLAVLAIALLAAVMG